MTPQLRALRLSLLAAITASAACIGGDDKVDSQPATDDSQPTSSSLCESPVAVPAADGSVSGFLRCADGTIVRAEALPASATVNVASCAGTESYQSCSEDADCTDRANGSCVTGYDDFSGDTSCGCIYTCESDSDCATGQICLPEGIVDTDRAYSSCVVAACTTNADCASEECSVTAFDDGCGPVAELACRAETDACRLDSDCDEASQQECAVIGAEWACRQQSCDIGRPLLIEGVARTAPPVVSADWAATPSPSVPEDPALRARLAQHWTTVAALEHASVASFARFTLQLMSLGAPPELLSGAQRAADDEVRHAQLAYGLASAYAGAAVGPGPLPLGDLNISLDPAQILRGLVAEACVGETLGVAEALSAAAACEDPRVAAQLQEIALDEQRHAALAWRCLRWMLQQRPELLDLAREEMEAALEGHLAELDAQPAAPAHGLLGERERLALRLAAAEAVVRPCFEAACAGLSQDRAVA